MWRTTHVTIFFLVTLMPWLDPPGVLTFKWDVNNVTAILVSALLGFLLQWSGALALGYDNFHVMMNFVAPSFVEKRLKFFVACEYNTYVLYRATSATSHVILGQFKTCVILLGGYMLFESDPGFVSICGAVVALVGMSAYTSYSLRESSREEKTSSDLLPMQIPPVIIASPKPKSNEEDEDQVMTIETSNVG